MIIRQHTTSEARRAVKITAGGATPGSMASSYTSAEGAAEWVERLCHPGVGVPLRTVSRGFIPACGLSSPSGFLPVFFSALRASLLAQLRIVILPMSGLIATNSNDSPFFFQFSEATLHSCF